MLARSWRRGLRWPRGLGSVARLTVRGPRAEDDERDNAPQVGGSPRGRSPCPDPSRDSRRDAFSSCGRGSRAGGFAQLPGGRPLADPIPHIPINGTAGFVVPGANTLPGGDLLDRARLPRPAVRLPAGRGHLRPEHALPRARLRHHRADPALAPGPVHLVRGGQVELRRQRRRRSELRSRLSLPRRGRVAAGALGGGIRGRADGPAQGRARHERVERRRRARRQQDDHRAAQRVRQRGLPVQRPGRRQGRGPVRLRAGARVRHHAARLARRRGHGQHQLARRTRIGTPTGSPG